MEKPPILRQPRLPELGCDSISFPVYDYSWTDAQKDAFDLERQQKWGIALPREYPRVKPVPFAFTTAQPQKADSRSAAILAYGVVHGFGSFLPSGSLGHDSDSCYNRRSSCQPRGRCLQG